MKTVTMYEAEDGKQFRDEAQCVGGNQFEPTALRQYWIAGAKRLRSGACDAGN